MSQSNLGLNISFPIYNADGTPFNNLVIKKATVDSIVMSLADKITGDVYYPSNDLYFTMQEYITYKGVNYILINPPTVIKEGMVENNTDLKGMTKYSLTFYHPMVLLGDFPFSDIAVTVDEKRYLSENKTFSWIGTPDEYIAKINKNLEGTEWIVVKSNRFPQEKDNVLSDVLSFDKTTIADALKRGYETWGVPYIIDTITQDEPYYDLGKRFKIVFGQPSNEIYASSQDEQEGTPFVFKFGQGVGLKNNSRTPRNNKIITRISAYGSDKNIPYGYPQIKWFGDSGQAFTYGNNVGTYYSVTIQGHTFPKIVSYPIYKGILGGQYVELIKHPFTRTNLMPSVYREALFNKVSFLNEDGSVNLYYNPDIELVDFYDAIYSEEYPYVNVINPQAPSYDIHQFEDIKPELGEEYIVNVIPLNKDLTPASGWDDTIDDDGNYNQSYFQITLPQLSFDLYACAAITQEMQINMRSGVCLGCTFTVQVDWEDYKQNFYDSEGNFAPDGQQRDLTKYPKSNIGSISVVVQKDTSTFGTIKPNIYQYPTANDQFVILGISLPDAYIINAERRLDNEMKSYMLENNVYYFDYPLTFDQHFLATHNNILSQIKPNTIVHFEYAQQSLSLSVKQLTIKYGEGVLPQYNITLTDNIEVVLNQIGQVAEDVEKLSTLIAILRQTYNRNVWDELAKKLSKTQDDTAQGLITFLRGIRGNTWSIDSNGNAKLPNITDVVNILSSTYSGDDLFSDVGFAAKTDEQGYGHITTDYLNVRKKFYAMMLEVVKRQYSGGNWVFGSAGNVFIDVEAYDVRGVRVLLDKDLNKEHRDLEVLTWVSTPADCYTWINSHEEQYGGDGLFAADSVNDLIRIVRSPSGLYTEQLYGCRVGDMFTEYDKTGGDYIVLTDDGWVDYDLMSEADRLGMVSYFRCYFLASDGDKQVDNMWYIGDQAYCQTININAGVTHQASNTLYWRLVVGKGANVEHKDLSCHFIDLSNELSVDVVDEQGTLHAGCIGYDATSGVEKEVSEIYDNRYCRLNYIQTDSGAWVEDVFTLTTEFLGSEIRIEGDIAVLNGGDTATLIGAEVRKDGTFNYLNVAVTANGLAAFAYGDNIINVSAPNSAGKKLHLSAEMRDGAQTCHVESTDIDVTETGSSSMASAVKERLAGFTLGAMGRHTMNEDGSDLYELNAPQRYYEAKIYSDGVLVLHLVPAEDLLSGDYYLYDTVSGSALPINKFSSTNITSGGIYKKRVTLADSPSAEDNVAQVGHQWNTERQHLVQIVVNGTAAPLVEGLTMVNNYSLGDKWVYRLSPKGIKMRSDMIEFFSGSSPSEGVGGNPVAIFRGSWKSTDTYYKGDVVEWHDLSWICIVASTTEEPSESSHDWSIFAKGKDGAATNIRGTAVLIANTVAQAEQTLLSGDYPTSGLVLFHHRDTIPASANNYTIVQQTPTTKAVIWAAQPLPLEEYDMFIVDDGAWIYKSGVWEYGGEWHIKGADGKDGELVRLEPDTVILEQTYERNEKGDLVFSWASASTTVKHIVGDIEVDDINRIRLQWTEDPVTGNAWDFNYSIAGNDIIVRSPKSISSNPQNDCRGYARITVTTNDNKTFVVYLTVCPNYLGTFHQETYKDITKEIRRRAVWQFDDNGVEQKYNYENQSYENALQKSKWITKIVNGSVEGGTLMQQTADFIHFGFVSGVNYDEAEEVITGNFKTGLKISEDGSEFTGDVYTLIEQEGSNDGIYGWRLSHNGSGSLAQGKISWTTDGTLTAKEGVFEKIQVVQSEIKNSVWSASGKDSQGHYGTYVNVGSINDGSNTTALSVRHDYGTNCVGDDWFAVLSYGNSGELHLLSSHDWMTLQPNQLQYKGSNDPQRKTLADWVSTRVKMHVPLIGVRRKLIELTSARTIDLSETENEDYETIICRHSSGEATVKLPVEPAIANGKEITISQRVQDGTIKIQKNTAATAQIRIAGATPADEITLPYEAEYDWIERHGAEFINHKNKMVYWGVKLIYNNNTWEALLIG